MYNRLFKRMLDFSLALVGLLFAWPVLLLIAVAIKIDDPGPAIFKQKRVGIHKSYFELYKFRSMKVDTPDVPTHLLENPEQYISRVGKFLRKTSLDELPQMINILKGEMSIIGPRPALWNQYDLIEERDKYGANDVRPGLTGWAQINGRDELEIPVKAWYDGEYVKNLSFAFDVKCFMGTISAVLKSEGVVEGGTGKMEDVQSKRQPRILLVANVAKEHVLKFHVPMIKRLAEQGWHIDVACSGDEEVPYCNHQFKMSYQRSPFNRVLLKGIKELKQIVEENDYDVVYCHTPVGGLAARIASINMRKKGTKVIYFAHGYHFFKGAPIQNWLIYYPIEKVMSWFTDTILLSNREDYRITRRRFKSCDARFVNSLGVNSERFQIEHPEIIRSEYRKEMNIPEDAVVLIYLAELIKNKNQTFLMRVLKRVLEHNQNVYLILAGFDHTDGAFEAYAKEIGVHDHIRFLGWREDVGNLLVTSDICTATSIREGFGINLVEAMMCGVPVVASKNRGHETIVRDGKNGFMVEQNDEETFAKRILQLMNDKKLYKKFVHIGIKRQDRYTCDTVNAQIQSILEEHLREN